MIIRTIDNVFVNLNNVTKIEFDFKHYHILPIVITHPVKREDDDCFYDIDDVLADMGVDTDDLNKIMDMFIDALEKDEPYFDFREAYLRTCNSPSEMIEVAETMSRLYDGKRD